MLTKRPHSRVVTVEAAKKKYKEKRRVLNNILLSDIETIHMYGNRRLVKNDRTQPFGNGIYLSIM